jgi:Phosphotransferase enzyme family
MTAEADAYLEGGSQTRVSRVGDTVHRSAGPRSPAVVSVLQHLADVGFSASPRPIGSGFDEDCNETSSFVSGESPQPHPWSDDAAVRIGESLGELHRATASVTPPDDPHWKRWNGRDLDEAPNVLSHGDLGPWNIVARDRLPVGFIDWDYTGPVDPSSEPAQVAWLSE